MKFGVNSLTGSNDAHYISFYCCSGLTSIVKYAAFSSSVGFAILSAFGFISPLMAICSISAFLITGFIASFAPSRDAHFPINHQNDQSHV